MPAVGLPRCAADYQARLFAHRPWIEHDQAGHAAQSVGQVLDWLAKQLLRRHARNSCGLSPHSSRDPVSGYDYIRQMMFGGVLYGTSLRRNRQRNDSRRKKEDVRGAVRCHLSRSSLQKQRWHGCSWRFLGVASAER